MTSAGQKPMPVQLSSRKGHEGAQHVLSAVGEVDDPQHAEDHGEAEAQERVERAVDEPQEELAQQDRQGVAEDHRHGACPHTPSVSWRKSMRASIWEAGKPSIMRPSSIT